MRKIAGYLTKNRSGKDQKIAQSTHENEYIKPRKTFWRNSKQFLSLHLAPPALHAQSEPAYLNPDMPVDTRVNDLLARMTLEEKTSQMTHTTRGIPRLSVPDYTIGGTNACTEWPAPAKR